MKILKWSVSDKWNWCQIYGYSILCFGFWQIWVWFSRFGKLRNRHSIAPKNHQENIYKMKSFHKNINLQCLKSFTKQKSTQSFRIVAAIEQNFHIASVILVKHRFSVYYFLKYSFSYIYPVSLYISLRFNVTEKYRW